jgi:hypothetical protein
MTQKTKAKRADVGFLHTVYGKPGYYDGDQIVYVTQGRWGRYPLPLVASIDLIRAQQRLSDAWRTLHGFDNEPDKYSYVRVRIGL